MHDAPSVSYPAGRSRFAGALLASGWLLGCAAAALWWLHSPGSWRLAAMLIALGAVGSFAARSWWRAPRGTLGWDGQVWNWSARPAAGAVAIGVGLDLQHVLLLRWTSGNASCWLWVERASRAERWDDLRRAVYSRATPEALQQAPSPAAKP